MKFLSPNVIPEKLVFNLIGERESSNIKKFLKRYQHSIISGLTSCIFRAERDAADACGLTFMELSKGIEDIT
jgi:hypothetical protein